jgi:glycosyltransferase involved in cell wall biosynthesis
MTAPRPLPEAPPREAQRPIRVVHVVRSLVTGGQEVMLCRLVASLDPARFSCAVVALQGHDREQGGPLWRELTSRGVEVVPMRAPAAGASMTLFPALAKVLFRLGADVIHAHNLQPLVYAGIASLAKPGARVVATAHGYRNWDGFRFGGPLRAILRRAIIVAVSPELRAFLEARGWHPARLRVIENGVDLAALAGHDGAPPLRSELGAAPGDWLVGSVGRLSPEKDHENLLRALRIVVAAEPRARLVVAGDGPLRTPLEALAGALGISERVRFVGEIAATDVPRLLRSLDAFCLPSQTEGTSLSLLEAMACEVPVVATAVGGTPSVVDNGAAARLVRPRDPEALASALLAASREGSESRRMAQRARSIVAQRFSLAAMAGAYADVYARLVHAPGHSSSSTARGPDLPCPSESSPQVKRTSIGS